VPVATDQFAAAWETFFRTTRRLRARAGKQDLGGLSLAQYQLLQPLRDADELTVGVLAEGAGVAAPTATRMLDCLERDGRLTRRHSETDRRSVLIALTPSGRDAVDTAHAAITAWRRRIFDALDPAEREQATALLTRISEVMEDQTP
jgi:DNA-binding MarR family transcriptional regulator